MKKTMASNELEAETVELTEAQKLAQCVAAALALDSPVALRLAVQKIADALAHEREQVARLERERSAAITEAAEDARLALRLKEERDALRTALDAAESRARSDEAILDALTRGLETLGAYNRDTMGRPFVDVEELTRRIDTLVAARAEAARYRDALEEVTEIVNREQTIRTYGAAKLYGVLDAMWREADKALATPDSTAAWLAAHDKQVREEALAPVMAEFERLARLLGWDDHMSVPPSCYVARRITKDGLAALKADEWNAAIDAAVKVSCLWCRQGARLDDAGKHHFVDDGMQPKAQPGRWRGCNAINVRALNRREP